MSICHILIFLGSVLFLSLLLKEGQPGMNNKTGSDWVLIPRFPKKIIFHSFFNVFYV